MAPFLTRSSEPWFSFKRDSNWSLSRLNSNLDRRKEGGYLRLNQLRNASLFVLFLSFSMLLYALKSVFEFFLDEALFVRLPNSALKQ